MISFLLKKGGIDGRFMMNTIRKQSEIYIFKVFKNRRSSSLSTLCERRVRAYVRSSKQWLANEWPLKK